MNDRFSTVGRKDKSPKSLDEVSEMFNVSKWTIRMWIDRFSIVDHTVDKNGGIWFKPHVVEQIEVVCDLVKTKGMNLESVRKHLNPEFTSTRKKLSIKYRVY
ncbi:MAG: MerR family transcriptional regulator [Bacteroidales bacterium]|jgi:DNA-binding transcriptional MerR regulator|nr:MerR family transcriptional regulator [Bacteroidales bacterium]